MGKDYRTIVIPGRFQTPYLHEGHKHLINTAINKEGIDTVFIAIGCTKDNVRDERNPYSYGERAEMILKEYPNVLIGYIEDEPNDDFKWSRKLDEILQQLRQPVLMGSRDSFISHYHGYFKYEEVDEIPDISATKIREQLNNK